MVGYDNVLSRSLQYNQFNLFVLLIALDTRIVFSIMGTGTHTDTQLAQRSNQFGANGCMYVNGIPKYLVHL